MREATAPRKSAVRLALDELNEAQTLQPITAEEVASIGDTLLWRILVEPYVRKHKGLIATTKSVDDAERVIAKVGRIVQIGCFCFQSKTTAGLELSKSSVIPKVGEYYLFEMYAGQEVHTATGHILRLLNDTELLMRVKDPEMIRGYL